MKDGAKIITFWEITKRNKEKIPAISTAGHKKEMISK
jgi:hypothetical protein